MLQLWFCGVCRKAGFVEFDDHAGVWEAFTAVADAHQSAEPECPLDGFHVRVAQTINDMPQWAAKIAYDSLVAKINSLAGFSKKLPDETTNPYIEYLTKWYSPLIHDATPAREQEDT